MLGIVEGTESGNRLPRKKRFNKSLYLAKVCVQGTVNRYPSLAFDINFKSSDLKQSILLNETGLRCLCFHAPLNSASNDGCATPRTVSCSDCYRTVDCLTSWYEPYSSSMKIMIPQVFNDFKIGNSFCGSSKKILKLSLQLFRFKIVHHQFDYSSSRIDARHYEPTRLLGIALRFGLFKKKSGSREMLTEVTIEMDH